MGDFETTQIIKSKDPDERKNSQIVISAVEAYHKRLSTGNEKGAMRAI